MLVIARTPAQSVGQTNAAYSCSTCIGVQYATRYHRLLLGPETLHLCIAVETHFRCGWLMLQPVRRCCDFPESGLFGTKQFLDFRRDTMEYETFLWLVACAKQRYWAVAFRQSWILCRPQCDLFTGRRAAAWPSNGRSAVELQSNGGRFVNQRLSVISLAAAFSANCRR